MGHFGPFLTDLSKPNIFDKNQGRLHKIIQKWSNFGSGTPKKQWFTHFWTPFWPLFLTCIWNHLGWRDKVYFTFFRTKISWFLGGQNDPFFAFFTPFFTPFWPLFGPLLLNTHFYHSINNRLSCSNVHFYSKLLDFSRFLGGFSRFLWFSVFSVSVFDPLFCRKKGHFWDSLVTIFWKTIPDTLVSTIFRVFEPVFGPKTGPFLDPLFDKSAKFTPFWPLFDPFLIISWYFTIHIYMTLL